MELSGFPKCNHLWWLDCIGLCTSNLLQSSSRSHLPFSFRKMRHAMMVWLYSSAVLCFYLSLKTLLNMFKMVHVPWLLMAAIDVGV
ncbi:hypothetical protein N665_0619s0006 [Sinapis alba]|nr:hypothetical protein N665_0619s0006 [Sinapis alba]